MPYSKKTIIFPFFFLNPLEYVLTPISQNVVFIGYDLGTMTGALGDTPLFTHFMPEIDSDCENGTPRSFQISFGTNIHELSAFRFAEKRKK